MKKLESKAKRIIAIFLCLIMGIGIMPSTAYAASADIVFNGYVSYGLSSVGSFTVNGEQALCVQHEKSSPQTGASNDGGSIYNNDKIKAALYYGITGDGNIFGSDWSRGTVVTSLVLSAIYNGTTTGQSLSGYSELMALAQAGKYPSNEASFSTTNPNVYVSGNIQRTENIKLNADTGNSFSFTIPYKVTFYNVTTGTTQTGGSASIKGGDTFYLAAPLDYGDDYSTGNLKGSAKEWTAIVYTTSSSSTQNLAQGVWTDSTKTISFTADFEVRTGHVKIIKTAEDGNVSGLQFQITGNGVDRTVTTGNEGTILAKDLLPGTYIVTEVSTPSKYVQPQSQTVTITSGNTASVTFSNTLKKFNVTVTKSDTETGEAQGDATLAGAVYGIYNSDELIDTYTTDSGGQFTTSYYVCGDNWTIREITPSEGYLLDETVHEFGAFPGHFTVEYNSVSNDVTEDVIKGNIQIVKHLDEENTDVETDGDSSDGNVGVIELPEEGALFQVYLKSAGSYDDAGENERDLVATNENGYALTKDLPYGVYVVHQVSGMEGQAFVSDFTVYVTQNGQTHYYILNNTAITAKIRIEKRDAETCGLIAAAGAGFKIKDSDGDYISLSYDYPTPATIDTFYVNDEGWLMLPESLKYGTYYLEEVQAPYGYVLDGDLVEFTVNGNEALVTVTKDDVPQKGTITVVKTGEVFSTVMETDGTYQPVYSIEGLAGAVYEIAATEDIYTLDGTLRASAGEVVGTVTTDGGGVAESTELYLGRYTVMEITAPDGMVLSVKANIVELTYAGQDVPVTGTSTIFYNERQKVLIELDKLLEQDQTFGIGMNGEIQSVQFGIYTVEELTAADGTLIPADGLIEIITADKNGCGVFIADLPFGNYYVQEISTNAAYLTDDTQYPVTFEYAGQDTALVTIAVNDGEPIINKLIRGSISGIKVDEDGKALAGAIIGLFKSDETEFTADTTLLTAESSKDGSFSFVDIPYGDWIVREIKAPTGYVLSEESYSVTIGQNGQVIEIEIENVLIRGSVLVTKTDTDGNLLDGAKFGLYDSAGKLIQEPKTVDGGMITIDGIAYGDYYIQEIEAPEGYELDSTKHEFSITENGQLVEIIVENEKTPKTATSTGSSVKTGDNNNIRLWIALMCIAGTGIVTVSVVRHRKRGAKNPKKDAE